MLDLTQDIQVVHRTWFARGGCATLYKGFLRGNNVQNRNLKLVVIKVPVIYHGKGGETEESTGALTRVLNREMAVWLSISHPNILPFLGICDASTYTKPGHFGLVSPFYKNGDINEYVSQKSDVNVLLLLAQVAGAIDYLHTLDPPVIHGDIKGANILINDLGKACLADFGISHIVSVKGFTTKNTFGSCRWSSVELHEEDMYNLDDVVSSRTTKASDVWTFGMTVLEVLTGQIPFFEIKRDIAVVIEVVLKGARPKRSEQALIDDAVWTLLEACWSQHPARRPDAVTVALILDLLVGLKKEGTRIDIPSIIILLEPNSPPTVRTRSEVEEKYYPCHFTGCSTSFCTLDECIDHECTKYPLWRMCQ